MANATQATIAATATADFAGEVGNSRRDLILQFNAFLKSYVRLGEVFGSDGVLAPSTPSIGTTVTLALSAGVITVAGVPVVVAAQTAQAFGALGTIPTATWGIIAIDRVAAGTTTFVSGAANYSTGYATEALAIAAAPAKTASKARVGYVTVLAASPGWVAGTDALAGGSGGTPATSTNYYTIAGPWEVTAQSANATTLGSVGLPKQIGNMAAVAITV